MSIAIGLVRGRLAVAIIGVALLVPAVPDRAGAAADASGLMSEPPVALAGLCGADRPRPTVASEPSEPSEPSDDLGEPAAPGPALAREQSRATKLGGTWRRLPRAPFASAAPLAAWADPYMVVVDPASGRTATYDAEVRRWQEHQPMPRSKMHDGRLVVTGEHALLLADHSSSVQADRFDSRSGRWLDAADPPLADIADAITVDGLVIAAAEERSAAAYDAAADCWMRLPVMPLPEPIDGMVPDAGVARLWEMRSLHWTGEQILAVVTGPIGIGGLGVVAFDPVSWTWQGGTHGPVTASADRPVYAYGQLWFLDPDTKTDDYVLNASYDPGTDRWAVIDTSCGLPTGSAIATETLILGAWPGSRSWDPRTGACYRLPRTDDRERTGASTVWTGRELIRWSGLDETIGRARPDGIAFRPPRRFSEQRGMGRLSPRVRAAIKARRRFGLDTDPAVVRELVQGGKTAFWRQYGFPIALDELGDVQQGAVHIAASQTTREYLRKTRIHGGTWVDWRAGGRIAIALTTPDADVIGWLDQRMPSWRLVLVDVPIRDLKRALWRSSRVSKDVDPTAMLWAAGIDQSAGRLSLMYDPDDVKRMRARKGRLERALGVPVVITSGRVRDL